MKTPPSLKLTLPLNQFIRLAGIYAILEHPKLLLGGYSIDDFFSEHVLPAIEDVRDPKTRRALLGAFHKQYFKAEPKSALAKLLQSLLEISSSKAPRSRHKKV